jgi:hypothetical protein
LLAAEAEQEEQVVAVAQEAYGQQSLQLEVVEH